MALSLQLHLALAAERGEISRLLDALAPFWDETGIPEGDRYKVDLALDEMVTNVIDYSGAAAQAGGEAGIHVTVAVEPLPEGAGRQVVADIRDNGVPHDPTREATPDLGAGVEDRPIGGLGVFLTRSVMDSMVYHRDGEWNHLRLTRKIAGAAPETAKE